MKQCPDQASVAAQLVAGECIRQIWPNGEPAPRVPFRHTRRQETCLARTRGRRCIAFGLLTLREYISPVSYALFLEERPDEAGCRRGNGMFGHAVRRGFRTRAAYARGKVRSDEATDVDGHGDADRLGQSLRARAHEGARQAAPGLVGRGTGGPPHPGEQRVERDIAGARGSHTRRGIRVTRREQSNIGQVGGGDTHGPARLRRDERHAASSPRRFGADAAVA